MSRQEIKIPKERVAVLIGTKGEIKNLLEKKSGVRISVNSDTGDVGLESKDSVAAFEMKIVVQAIGRGFSPENAMLLFSEEYGLDILNIQDFVGKSKKTQMRLKGRVIGAEGKSRKMIERLTECHVSVYGKTIAILGEIEYLSLAKRAIEMLLEGSPHGNVFKWLEVSVRNLKNKQFEEKL
ncbi:MAG: KH domain-containing protein [archaeon]